VLLDQLGATRIVQDHWWRDPQRAWHDVVQMLNR